jgi:hypothetical protein
MGRSTTHLLRAGGVEASSPQFPNMIPDFKNGFIRNFDSPWPPQVLCLSVLCGRCCGAPREAGRAVVLALVCVRAVRRSRGGARGRPVDRVTLIVE